MAGYATVQALLDSAQKSSESMSIGWRKAGNGNNTTSVWCSLWDGAGDPPAGAHPAAGLGNAAAVSDATLGAMVPFPGTLPQAPASKAMWMLRGSVSKVSTSSTVGTLLIVDRLASVTLSLSQVDGAISPALDGTARLASGEGAMLVGAVTVVLGAAANTFAFTYTNQAGTGSRVTPTMTSVASRAVTATPYGGYLFAPLQDGDIGIRSVENWDLITGSASGTVNWALVKPLAAITILGSGDLVMPVTEVELAISLSLLPKIPANACLAAYYIFGGTGASYSLIGSTRYGFA